MNDRMSRMYTLMVMYLISKSRISLTNIQIITFFVENNYTDYFNIQEIISNIVESGNVIAISKDNSTKYYITEEGKEALNTLKWYIPPVIVEDMDEYLDKFKLQ